MTRVTTGLARSATSGWYGGVARVGMGMRIRCLVDGRPGCHQAIRPQLVNGERSTNGFAAEVKNWRARVDPITIDWRTGCSQAKVKCPRRPPDDNELG